MAYRHHFAAQRGCVAVHSRRNALIFLENTYEVVAAYKAAGLCNAPDAGLRIRQHGFGLIDAYLII